MQSDWTIHLKSGFDIVVPADLDNAVTLTLLEYEDWPEPEYGFLRALIKPNMRLLDADTGYGLYALNLAQALQGQGRLIALQPDPLFARSVADNGLQAVIEMPSHQAQAPAPADGEGGFDLILLGAAAAVDPQWLQSVIRWSWFRETARSW